MENRRKNKSISWSIKGYNIIQAWNHLGLSDEK
jgi:hypothetical protein